MDFGFQNKVVIVTGASAGIGEAVAYAFAKEGAKIICNSRSYSSISKTVDTIIKNGGTAAAVCGDVAEPKTACKIAEESTALFGKIDILVNNAGIVIPGTIDTLSLEDFDQSFNTNVKSIFMLSKAVIPHMRKNPGGVIVNISSIAAIKGTRNRLLYSASKGAVVSMTRSMALDLAAENIRVNCICPGMTYSPSLERRIADSPDPKSTKSAFISAVPIGRLGQPEDIASSVLFAASDKNAFMTGSVITVDGGKSL